jgi:hypothetical protein
VDDAADSSAMATNPTPAILIRPLIPYP